MLGVNRLTMAAIGAAGALGLLLYVGHLRDEVADSKADAAFARLETRFANAQGGLNQAAADIVQSAQARELNITLGASEAAHEIASLPDGLAPVPDAVLSGWSAAIDRLRGEAADATGGVDPGGAAAAGPLPAPGPP